MTSSRKSTIREEFESRIKEKYESRKNTVKKKFEIEQEKYDEIVSNAIENKTVHKYYELTLHPDIIEFRGMVATMMKDHKDDFSKYESKGEVTSVAACYYSRDSMKQDLPLVQWYKFENRNPIGRFVAEFFISLGVLIMNIFCFLRYGIFPLIVENSMVPSE